MFLLEGGSPVRNAGVAQLVEHDVANVVVVGSNPITRSSVAVSYQVSADGLAREGSPGEGFLKRADSWSLIASRFSFLLPVFLIARLSCEPSRAVAAIFANLRVAGA